jgi:hypothetical protein
VAPFVAYRTSHYLRPVIPSLHHAWTADAGRAHLHIIETRAEKETLKAIHLPY